MRVMVMQRVPVPWFGMGVWQASENFLSSAEAVVDAISALLRS